MRQGVARASFSECVASAASLRGLLASLLWPAHLRQLYRIAICASLGLIIPLQNTWTVGLNRSLGEGFRRAMYRNAPT